MPSITGISMNYKGNDCNPLVILIQHMRLDSEDNNSSVSMIYLGQSITHLFSKKQTDQSINS